MGLLSLGKKPVEQLMKEGVKSEAELKQLITAACERGAVHAKFFLDAHGPSKEATENVLLETVAKVTKEKGLLFSKGEIENSLEAEGLYSAFATVEVVTNNFQSLVKLFLTYAPASVEILEPQRLSLPIKEAQDILLDASQSTQMYSKYIMEHTMTPEQKADFQERLKRKAEYGAKMKEKAQSKK